MLLTILTLVGTLVPTILQNKGVIGAGTNNLISALLGPVETLIANLKTGNSSVQDGLAALGALSGVVEALKATTGLPATVLTELDDITKDIAAGLAAYVKAGGGLDLSVYAPIAEV